MRRTLVLALSVLACLLVGLAPPSAADDSHRVFFGDDAAPGQVPGVALVLDQFSGSQCTGTLVTPTQVVTAAHCVTDATPGSLFVALGFTQASQFPDQSENHEVTNVQVHPLYNGELSFDVALLTFEVASAETPVRVVESDEDALWTSGTVATLAGWGQTEDGDPATLQVAQVPVGDSDCFGMTAVLCAGTGQPSACTGDSGGPLMVEGLEGEPVLVGAVTAGIAGCGTEGFPDFYAELGHPAIRDNWLEPLLVDPVIEPEDTLGPRAASKSPTGTGVKRSANAKAVLSEAVDPTTVSGFSVRLERLTSSGPVRVTDVVVSLLADGTTIRLDPYGSKDKRLAKKARYRVTVTTFVRDLAGNAFDQDRDAAGTQPLTWTFRTGVK